MAPCETVLDPRSGEPARCGSSRIERGGALDLLHRFTAHRARHRDGLDRQPLGAQQGRCLGPGGDRLRLWALPFPILGIDSDNGLEFINADLFEYCGERKITFTRSRPGNKNDGAHVEQKNWTHVRELVGYLRFDSDAELEVLNEIWELDARFTNHLLAQQKLQSRERAGSKVIKRHDRAQTPVERAIAPGVLTLQNAPAPDGQPRRSTQRPSRRQISVLTAETERRSSSKAATPIPRRVNRDFNYGPDPRF